jgi:hypothetical protein
MATSVRVIGSIAAPLPEKQECPERVPPCKAGAGGATLMPGSWPSHFRNRRPSAPETRRGSQHQVGICVEGGMPVVALPGTLRNRWGPRRTAPGKGSSNAFCRSPEVPGKPLARGLGRAQVVRCRVPFGSFPSASANADTYGSSGSESLPAHRRRLRRTRARQHSWPGGCPNRCPPAVPAPCTDRAGHGEAPRLQGLPEMGRTGIEPVTLRLRVSCSTS